MDQKRYSDTYQLRRILAFLSQREFHLMRVDELDLAVALLRGQLDHNTRRVLDRILLTNSACLDRSRATTIGQSLSRN